MLPVVNTRCVTNSWSHLADLCKCFSQKFLVDPTKIGYFVLTLMMDVHCTIYKHTNTKRKWIKLLKPGHPNMEKVEPPHLHTWGPVWPDPTADSHSGRRKWDSCSCATWSGAACRFWSAPSGTGQTQFVFCMNAQQYRNLGKNLPHLSLLPSLLHFSNCIQPKEDHCCIYSTASLRGRNSIIHSAGGHL